MKKILFTILFATYFLVSCNSDDAVSWNASLSEAYNKSVDDIDSFEELISLETMGDTLINDQIVSAGTSLLNHLEKSIKYFEAQEVPSGAKGCHASALEMFKSMANQVSCGITFTNFSIETAEAEVDVFADKYDDLSRETALKVNEFMDEHETFKRSISEE